MATERRIAGELGGRRVFNSGAGFDKGDVRVDPKRSIAEDGTLLVVGPRFRVESKRTWTDSYSIGSMTWRDVVRAASGAYVVMHVQIQRYEYAVVESRVFLPLMEKETLEYTRKGAKTFLLRATPPLPELPIRLTLACGPEAWDVVIISWSDFLTYARSLT